MALFGKDEKAQRPDDTRPFVTGTAVRAPEPVASDEPVQAHLGKGSRVEGKLVFEGSVRLDGIINGEIEAQESVIIGETAVVGNEVEVTGSVSEYVPSTAPGSAPLTELVGPMSVTLISAGNLLPAPTTLAAAELDPLLPDGCRVYLEALEGMRVAVDSLTVVGPTGGTGWRPFGREGLPCVGCFPAGECHPRCWCHY
jgi:hypothetical protein